MEVNQFQDKIVKFCKEWEKYREFKHTEQNTFNHLVEEMGELASQFVNRDKGRKEFDGNEFDNAIGDILIHLVCLANLRGLSVEQLIDQIIKEDSKRLLEKSN
jgi:NTP pyrophosphatase (non-canonical NTP hydrolase)